MGFKGVFVFAVGEHGKPGAGAESKLVAQVAWNNKLINKHV